ncbi:class I SAM-dependent methyltransferase [Hyphococcus sp.]|jgi:ubiquinone/menaquinone biosynthesis C-methylase UbiE|uniref:class I SAM-dependent methyltransferase n=1 Tax=Hyphococcus sp. TaxID=2038636 RepID=UPI003D142A43
MRGAFLKYFVVATFAALAACSRAPAPEEPSETPAVEAPEDGLNLDVWLERMEVGSRELYSAREAVLSALELEDGDIVADIGAGTGLYTLMFAEAVGAHGRVYAEDIESLFLDLINQRAEDSGFDNITAVLGRENDVTLPENTVDLVFIADTYHYFEDRETVMKSVLKALKPGGSLVVVDYDLKPGEPRPEDKGHVRFGRAGVISEIEYVGFAFVEEKTVEGLEENYFLRFAKPAE